MSAANNDDDKLKRLADLRKKNAERWKLLKGLHAKGTGECSLLRALEVEHELVETQVVALPMDGIGQKKPDPRCFVEEVVDSHDQLRQANAILQQQIRLARNRLETVRAQTTKHHQVRQALRGMMPPTHLASESELPSTTDEFDEGPIREEVKELYSEIEYVANMVENKQEETGTHNKKRKAAQISDPTTTTTEPAEGRWSLNRLIVSLVERWLSSPGDPFLMVDQLPIDPAKLETLHRCGLTMSHPDNPRLVCLRRYI